MYIYLFDLPSITSVTGQTDQVFLHLPMTVLLNSNVTAICEATDAVGMLWEVNSTLVNDYTTHQAFGARGIFPAPTHHKNDNTSTLSVFASLKNNQTVFRCQVSWNGTTNFSDAKTLIVHGE